MATFPRGHNAKTTLLRKINIPTITATTPVKANWYVDPSDSLTLRGIPAIGRGVAGHIPGTRPDIRTD